jgi:hypothetical protein
MPLLLLLLPLLLLQPLVLDVRHQPRMLHL